MNTLKVTDIKHFALLASLAAISLSVNAQSYTSISEKVASKNIELMPTDIKLSYMTGTNTQEESTTQKRVTFSALSATADGSRINLEWSTSAETNNKGFEVQRSEDGVAFATVGWVDGFGQSSKTNDYTFTDDNVQPNVLYYYRIKQRDNNSESFIVTNIIKARVIKKTSSSIVWGTVSPVSKDRANLILNLLNSGLIEVNSFDLAGALIAHTSTNVHEGINVVEIPFTQALNSGTYITHISINGETKSIKWMN